MAIKEMYSVYTVPLCNYLIKNGFEMINARPRNDAANLVVFRFYVTDALLAAVEDYKNNKR